MCVPGCLEAVAESMERRRFMMNALQGAMLTVGAAVLGSGCATNKSSSSEPCPVDKPCPHDKPCSHDKPCHADKPCHQDKPCHKSPCSAGDAKGAPCGEKKHSSSFSRVIDLTHVLLPSFPTYSGKPQVSKRMATSRKKDGYETYVWSIHEHTGTHLDAPCHFGEGVRSADQIPAEELVVPLAVIDIRSRASSDPDTSVTPADIAAWESEHGRLPEGACVAMLSGWAEKASGKGFRNADAKGTMHFPGFHAEAADFLIKERKIQGIAVDTLSLDMGASKDFDVHTRWLPSNRWGLECVANLDRLPPSGATLVVGATRMEGSTGGPARVFALV